MWKLEFRKGVPGGLSFNHQGDKFNLLYLSKKKK